MAGPFGYGGLAIKTNGTLWAWGYGGQGQLGLNKTYAAPTPAYGGWSSPTQVGTNTNWSKIRPSGNSVIALKTDNTIWAWGSNTYGGLGQNDTVLRSSPAQIPGTTWSSISASYKAGGGIKTDGTAWVWGNNDDGMLGLNWKNPTGGARSSPVQLSGDWSALIGGANSRNMMGTKTE